MANLNKYDEFEEKIITTLNNYLKVNLNSNDIDITHQLPTSKFGKVPVIIKFVKRSTRNTVFNKKRLLHKTGFENSFFVVQNLRIAFTKAGFILILVIP